jgi:hypothetical protein
VREAGVVYATWFALTTASDLLFDSKGILKQSKAQ